MGDGGGRKMWSAKMNVFWWCVRGRGRGKRRGSNVLAAEGIWKGATDVIGRGKARGRCFARSARFRTADSTQCAINLFT